MSTEALPAGIIPDIADEAAFRAGLLNVLKVPALIAGFTPTQWDDQVIDLATTIVSTDATWAKVYALLVRKAAAAAPGAWDWKRIAVAIQEILAAVIKIINS